MYRKTDDFTDPPMAKLVADAIDLAIIKSLIEKIEAVSPVLARDAMEQAADRVRRDHWRITEGRLTTIPRTARGIASLARIDEELACEVFAPSYADLIVDELRDFIAAHEIAPKPAAKAQVAAPPIKMASAVERANQHAIKHRIGGRRRA